MKKSIKGALAAGGAAVLLMGGAGTLAYWTDSATLNAGSVTAGTLSLSDGTCDAGWKYATGSAGAGNSVSLIVPGDKITKTCEFTITATGDNLTARLTTPSTVAFGSGATGSFSATVGATYAIDNAAVPATITSAQNNKVVKATITVDFPFGTDETGSPKINANDVQSALATLNGLQVSVEQQNANAAP